jgi:hypothetical protein
MPVENITVWYDVLITNASLVTAVDGALTETFWGEPWHWTLGTFVTMVLIYMKTEDAFVTSLPGIIVLITLITYGKITTQAMLPFSMIFMLAFASFFYGILKKRY